MFTLVFGLIDAFLKSPKLNVLVLGLEGSGKTYLLERIKSKFTLNFNANISPEKIMPTIGLNVCKFVFRRNEVTIWDLGGKPELRGIWKDYFGDCHCVIWVVDCSNPSSLHESKEVLWKEVLQNKKLENVPLLVLLNRAEKNDKIKEKVINTFEFERLSTTTTTTTKTTSGDDDKKYNRFWMIQGISGTNDEGLQEALEVLFNHLDKNARWVNTDAYL